MCRLQLSTSTVLRLQVPFSVCEYLLSIARAPFSTQNNKFALPFSLPRAFTRPVRPLQGFSRLHRGPETFIRTFSTHVHTQPMPRLRLACAIDANWSLTVRGVRHIVRTVLREYLLSYHTVNIRDIQYHLWWTSFQRVTRQMPRNLEYAPQTTVSASIGPWDS